MKSRTTSPAILLALTAAFGCGSESAGTSPGTVSLSIWGEDYIADSIPPLMGSEAGFVDGWTVRYTRFLVNVGDFSVAAVDGTAGGAPATTTSTAGNATAADVTLMQTGAYGIYVEGEGTRAGTTVRFRWGFTQTIAYSPCSNADGSLGLAVPSGGNVDAQLTIHGDHFFYDDLQSEEASLRFDAIAAADVAPVGDGDGTVTLE